jgi:hypothetical protein
MAGKPQLSASEHAEQVALVRRLRADGHFVAAIPNGGLRDAITARRLRDEGVVAGMPDLVLLLAGGRSIWVEMKRRDRGKPSPEQKKVHAALKSLGHCVIVANGAAEAYNKISEAINGE